MRMPIILEVNGVQCPKRKFPHGKRKYRFVMSLILKQEVQDERVVLE
jgi:hypothetical protein